MAKIVLKIALDSEMASSQSNAAGDLKLAEMRGFCCTVH